MLSLWSSYDEGCSALACSRCMYSLHPKGLLLIPTCVREQIVCLAQEKYVHRDITSSNILLKGDGHACLADFGLAHQLATAESIVVGSALQADSILIGTFGYMAPEYGAKSGVSRACLLPVPARLWSCPVLQRTEGSCVIELIVYAFQMMWDTIRTEICRHTCSNCSVGYTQQPCMS